MEKGFFVMLPFFICPSSVCVCTCVGMWACMHLCPTISLLPVTERIKTENGPASSTLAVHTLPEPLGQGIDKDELKQANNVSSRAHGFLRPRLGSTFNSSLRTQGDRMPGPLHTSHLQMTLLSPIVCQSRHL